MMFLTVKDFEDLPEEIKKEIKVEIANIVTNLIADKFKVRIIKDDGADRLVKRMGAAWVLSTPIGKTLINKIIQSGKVRVKFDINGHVEEIDEQQIEQLLDDMSILLLLIGDLMRQFSNSRQ